MTITYFIKFTAEYQIGITMLSWPQEFTMLSWPQESKPLK